MDPIRDARCLQMTSDFRDRVVVYVLAIHRVHLSGVRGLVAIVRQHPPRGDA